MANMWFSVLVLIFVHNVFAIECPSRGQDIKTCDQCLRCGGTWCSEPKNTGQQCWYKIYDDSCNKPEKPTQIKEHLLEGDASSSISPIYAETSLLFKREGKLRFTYNSPVKKKVSHKIYNTTQTSNIYVKTNAPPKCDGSKCDIEIVATVGPDFCTTKGTDMEFIFVGIQVENATEEAVIKYHVPCACGCSKEGTERQSPRCNGNGDFSCGGCSCYEGWSGAQCDKTECETGRGDVRCNNPLMHTVACSGNGYCGPCDTCICYKNMTGSQYFDQDNYCSDICMDTSGCETCLTNGTLGPCDPLAHEGECTHSLMLLKYNETLAARSDDLDRMQWVKCNSSFKDPDCYVEYVAMRTEDGISVMVVEPCNKSGSGALVVDSSGAKVPIILGVLGILAAVAAVGGVMLWKHLNSPAAMPFSSPDYENIDAEDCVGENPLYKPPTSTFTNPQFGKC